jgi:predicted NUDIX family NTP pyrophosphohydrolase
MTKRSAGVLIYRHAGERLEVLLVHPGGPFWRGRDAGAWQIPKGLIEEGESAAAAARRETEEELGLALAGEPVPLATIRQKGGKVVEAFALEQEVDADAVRSNSFELEWPPRSGKVQSFPEIDAARWFALDEAASAMLESQRTLLDALLALTGTAAPDRRPGP